jgi:hypothetical protein
LKLARASPSLGARCAQAWRARALPRAILQGAGLRGQTGRADEAPRDVPAYQSGREFDEELIGQLNALPEFFAAFGFANAKTPGFEADDFLAAAVAAEERAGGSVVVASGDRDSFQLASATTTILYPSRGREIARIEPEEVRQRYGVDPKQVPDFIALRGDPSDKLPGAPGVGPKRAAQLLRRYGTLDAVLGADPFTCAPKVVTTVGTHKAIPRAKRPPYTLGRGGRGPVPVPVKGGGRGGQNDQLAGKGTSWDLTDQKQRGASQRAQA